MLAAMIGASAPLGAAEETDFSAKLHPWGQFQPGAWKIVRVVAETLNKQGQVVSTSKTDTKTTLVGIDPDGVTLEIQACMEVAGKRFEAEPQTVKQGFHGEMLGPHLALKELVDGELVIEGQTIACKVRQLESVLPSGKTTTTIHYSTTIAPYVLKRESVTFGPDGKTELSRTCVEVTSLNMPVRVRGELKNGVFVRMANRTDANAVATFVDVLPEVPGGIVANRSKEIDKNGRLVRRSTLELIDYGEEPERDRSGIFGRKRPSRYRVKSSPR